MEFFLGMLAGVAVLYVGSVIEDRIWARRARTKIHSALEEREGRKLSTEEGLGLVRRLLDDGPADPPV